MVQRRHGSVALLVLLSGCGLATPVVGQQIDDIGWLPDTTIDPITDVRRVGVRLDNIRVWCEPPARFSPRRLEVVIVTDGVPEGQVSVAGTSIGLPIETADVTFEYRFDQAQGRRGTAWVADDHQGIRLCPGIGQDCAKPFVQKMHAASQLIYRVDVLVTGSETARVSLDGGKENLLAVMNECNVEPQTFRDIGSE